MVVLSVVVDGHDLPLYIIILNCRIILNKMYHKDNPVHAQKMHGYTVDLKED
jgi:hypothetical protein